MTTTSEPTVPDPVAPPATPPPATPPLVTLPPQALPPQTLLPATTAPARPSTWALLRPLVLRIHFYAGVLVAPFLVVACLTGLAYVFSPQLSDLVYREQFFTEPAGAPRPVDEQAAAALGAHPDGALASVVVPSDPGRTTSVVLSMPDLTDDRELTVYVDPYTAEVRGALVTWSDYGPLQTTLDDLHRNLLLGDVGRNYSELAASWLPVLVLGGLALWIGRRRAGKKARALLLPPAGARPGRSRVLGWHGATGIWLALALLFISVTGLTWSAHAGERFSAAVTALDGRTPKLEAAPVAVPAGATPIGVDAALAAGRDAGLVGRLRVAAPVEPGEPFQVEERADGVPIQKDKVAVDPFTGQVTERVAWEDFPLLAQLTSMGISAHMGLLFGLPNQLALAAMALGLLCVIFWGYRMWWQRRPARASGAARLTAPAPRGGLRTLPQPVLFGVVAVTVAVGWAAPVLGVSLVVFLVLDAVSAVRTRRRAATVSGVRRT